MLIFLMFYSFYLVGIVMHLKDTAGPDLKDNKFDSDRTRENQNRKEEIS